MRILKTAVNSFVNKGRKQGRPKNWPSARARRTVCGGEVPFADGDCDMWDKQLSASVSRPDSWNVRMASLNEEQAELRKSSNELYWLSRAGLNTSGPVFP